LIFYAGAINQNNQIETNGGRVLSVVGIDKNIEKARTKVYKDITKVNFNRSHYRKDIGL
jgi:phosphoribosylamine--glycine ligase